MEEIAVSSQSIVLLVLLFAFTSIYILIKSRAKNREKNTAKQQSLDYPPELRPYPFIGHLPQFLANRHRMLDWVVESLSILPTNTLVFQRPGGVRGVITAHPANVEHFLRSRCDNYPKGALFRATLHDFLGNGIFNSNAEEWRLQRKTASLEFNTRSLRAFVSSCVHHELHHRLIPLLLNSADTGNTLDLQDILERFAFDNVCRVAFDLDPNQLTLSNTASDDKGLSGFAEAFKDAANLSAARFRYAVPQFWRVEKMFNFGAERRHQESIAIVHDFADRIVRSRKKEIAAGHEKHDLLSRFMASRDEDFSDEFLRDIVISFLLAGRDTTSSALAWFFWLLSSRPDVEQRILAEIASVRARRESDGGTSGFDLEELREMHYLHAAITESMRLYPPVPVNSTTSQNDDVLPDGTAIEKGWFMAYNSYAMGRMKAVWGEDAAEYRPERWLEADGMFRPESPFKFVAFHAGPRMCLGKEMAYIQMKSVAACVLERFVVCVDGDFVPEKVMSFTLRMKDGLPVIVKERAKYTLTNSE